MSCTCCGRPTVEMTVQGEYAYALLVCVSCNHRCWTIDGRPASIDEVVDAIRGERAQRWAA